MTQSATSQVSPSPMEIAPGCGSGIMQLPVEVFHYLLGFVTLDDIKTARLVNKHWRQVTTTPLRRLSKEIKFDHKVFDCVTKMNDGRFPVYRFEIKLYEDPQQIKVCYPYFPGICAWVKELTLKMDMNLGVWERSQIRMEADTFPRDCIYQDLTHLNLRLFEKSPKTRNPKFWQGFTDFVQSIIRNSPNLREINASYLYNKGRKTALLPSFQIVEDIFSNATSKLSCIDFQEVPLENIDWAKWSTLNLKLRKLGINLPRSSDLIDLLANFLESQTGTLQELILNLTCCNNETPAPVAFTFPRMETLQQLGFKGNVSRTVVTFPGIDYAQLFPSLKKLDLQNSGIEWRNFLDGGNNLLKPTNTVEELIFPSTGLDFTSVVTTSSLFPCLRKLELEIEIRANNVFMKAVFENMTNLEVLSLIGRGYYSYDHLITGMDLHVCRMFQGVMTETWIKNLKTTERRSLARLQNLKTLKLSNGNPRLICFSRLSFHVFQQMNSLKCLDLNGSADRPRSRIYYNENEKQFLADLREQFVVL